MECKNQRKQVQEKIKIKFPYLDSDDIDATFDMAFSDYLALRYPSYNNRPKENIENELDDWFVSQWVYKRMVDILERVGGSSVVSYKENGISIQYASGNIDSSLKAQILPKIGVPK